MAKQRSNRYAKLDKMKEKGFVMLPAEEVDPSHVLDAIDTMKYDHVRAMILDTGRRIDGRDTKTIRPIVGEVSVLPRAHGSALFTRGETQAIVA